MLRAVTQRPVPGPAELAGARHLDDAGEVAACRVQEDLLVLPVPVARQLPDDVGGAVLAEHPAALAVSTIAVAAAVRLTAANPTRTQVWSLVWGSCQLPASSAGSAPSTAPRMSVTEADSAVITQAWPTVHDQPGCSQAGPRRRFDRQAHTGRRKVTGPAPSLIPSTTTCS